MFLRIILIFIIGYFVYQFLKKILLPNPSVKGKPKGSAKKKYNGNIEDAEYEEIDK